MTTDTTHVELTNGGTRASAYISVSELYPGHVTLTLSGWDHAAETMTSSQARELGAALIAAAASSDSGPPA